jgi:ketosteroid isomerase-like protein
VTVAASNTAEESQIRVLIEDRVKAARAKDAVALVANHAPEVVTFDVVNPLQNIGADAVKQRAEQWFASFQGPIEFEIQELCISRGEEVAFCHFLNRVRGSTTAGTKVDMWWRATMCCRKIDSKWMIVHEHDSVPFDMETGKASIDLKP